MASLPSRPPPQRATSVDECAAPRGAWAASVAPKRDSSRENTRARWGPGRVMRLALWARPSRAVRTSACCAA